MCGCDFFLSPRFFILGEQLIQMRNVNRIQLNQNRSKHFLMLILILILVLIFQNADALVSARSFFASLYSYSPIPLCVQNYNLCASHLHRRVAKLGKKILVIESKTFHFSLCASHFLFCSFLFSFLFFCLPSTSIISHTSRV